MLSEKMKLEWGRCLTLQFAGWLSLKQNSALAAWGLEGNHEEISYRIWRLGCGSVC